MDQIHSSVHAITRHNPDQRKTVVLVAHSAFHTPPWELQPSSHNLKVNMHGIPPLTIPGQPFHRWWFSPPMKTSENDIVVLLSYLSFHFYVILLYKAKRACEIVDHITP